MICKIKGIITNVGQSKKNSSQYVNIFDLDTATQYSIVSRLVDFTGAPQKVPVEIEAVLSPRVFTGEKGSSTVLYVDQASFKKS